MSKNYLKRTKKGLTACSLQLNPFLSQQQAIAREQSHKQLSIFPQNAGP